MSPTAIGVVLPLLGPTLLEHLTQGHHSGGGVLQSVFITISIATIVIFLATNIILLTGGIPR